MIGAKFSPILPFWKPGIEFGTCTIASSSPSLKATGVAPKLLPRNVRLRQNERSTGDSNDPFVWPAGYRRRKAAEGDVGDVYADHGEISICKGDDVWASGS